MSPEPAVVDESSRPALHRLAPPDTPPDPVFDAITAAAAQACGVPIALVSLVEADRQWFKSQFGLPGLFGTTEPPRDMAFCDHAIRSDALFEVDDATLDPRFAADPLVTGDPGIRFCAGAPIVLPGGERIGTVCVIDRLPRRLDDAQRAMLTGLARIAAAAVADRARQAAVTAALEASERRHRSLYESTPALMHSVDHEGRLVHVSDLWLKVFGYTRDEVIGRPSASFYTPESQRHGQEVALPAFFRTGRSEGVEYDMVCKDGRVLSVLLSAVMERDELGRHVRSLSVLHDLSEKKRLAVELDGAVARLTAVADNVPALLCHCDAGGVVRFVNRAFQAAAGLPIDQIVGRPLSEVLQAVDPTGYLRLEPRVAEVMRGQRQEFELGLLTTAGLRQFRTTLVPEEALPEAPTEKAQRDQATGFCWMAYDITGRKALELRLADSEQRYRALFDHINSGVALHEIVIDHQGRPIDYRYLAMNAAFTAMSGLDPLTAIGRCVTELFPGIEADSADWIGVYGRVVQTGEPAHFEQHSAVLDRWFEVVAYRPAAGQFAVIAQDITQRKSGSPG